MRLKSTRIVGVLALTGFVFACVGCDKLVVKAKPTAVSVESMGGVPVIVETPEAKEDRELREKGSKLLSGREFDEIERTARELRASKAQWENGFWKLGSFYSGFSNLPDEASEEDWKFLLADLRSWVKAKPDSVTARTALGRALRDYAWKARGSGWAETVTPQGWKLFHARLAEGRAVLMEVTNSTERCPLWFTSLLGIGLGEGWPRPVYDKIFSAGTNYMREYVPIYGVKCYHLLPRWHGKEDEFEEFARDVADELGGEEGDILYARIVWDIHAGKIFKNIFRESRLSWPRTKRGFLLLQKRYPESLAVTSEFCQLAGTAGDWPTAKGLFVKLGGKIDLTVWDEEKRYVECRKWAFAR